MRFYNVKTSTELSVGAKSTTVLCFVPYKLYTFGSRSKLRIKELAVRFLGESVFIAGDARVVVCMDIKSGGGLCMGMMAEKLFNGRALFMREIETRRDDSIV